MDFEKALGRLQETIQLLEGGQLSLEDSLTKFEEGVKLMRACQEYLNQAEKRVEILTSHG